MKRMLAVIAVVFGAGVFAVARNAEPVFACSGPPAWQQMADAEVIFEGRVASARELPEESDVIFRAFEIVIAVSVPHRNATADAVLVARAQVPRDVPVMCPQFDPTEQFVGRYLVSSLHEREGRGLVIDRWSTPFIGDEPAGAEYELAANIARIAAGSDPTAPSLAVTPSPAGCGQLVTVRGARFAPDSVYHLSPIGTVLTWTSTRSDAAGNFNASFVSPSDHCEYEYLFVEAWPEGGTPYGDGGVPVAIVRLPIVRAPAAPDAGTGLIVLTTADKGVPWGSVVMVAILFMSFAGGTVAIARSVRRRR